MRPTRADALTRRWPAWLEAAIALLLGVALAQCFGHGRPGALSLVALAAFVALLWRDPHAAGRTQRGAVLGWCLGLGWFGAGLWWIDISLHVYGGMSQTLALPALLLLAAGLGLFPAAAAAAATSVAPPHRRTPWPLTQGLAAVAAFAAAWSLSELARGLLLTGFPWLALGYAQVGDPLAGFAPVLGVQGVGLAAAAVAALLAALSQLSTRGAAAALALLATLALGGRELATQRWTTPQGPLLRIALLQGAVPQSDKFQPDALAPTLALYGDWLRQLQADLIVTPETAVPALPEQLPSGWLDALDQDLRDHHSQALVGIPLTRDDGSYTNSALGLGGSTRYRYDKDHLVPFGEFIPTGLHWFVRLLQMPLGDFARGGLRQASMDVRGVRVAPTICYEDLFGAELARRFRDPARAPNLIANLTNLAWFGDTVALPQHLQIAQMRALEFQLPTVRATNTGVTAVIGADGRVLGQLQPMVRGVLSAEIRGAAGVTPYAWMAARAGDWPLLLGLAAGLAALIRSRRRRGP